MTTTNGTASAFTQLLANVLWSRRDFLRGAGDVRRDYNAECGYPEAPGPEDYQALYDREPVAARVVEVLPRESWQVQPQVYEVEDAETVTPFEQAWDALGRQLRGEHSYYQDEAGSPVWEVLRRADEQSGIGSYGVILLGLDDGADPRQSAVPTAGGDRRLLYLQVFPEAAATVTAAEEDPHDRRYGQPTAYTLRLADPRANAGLGPGLGAASQVVHWTRVVHIADNLTTSSVYGVPRMQSVYNRLADLRKLYGGSAEMYWRGAFPGFTFELPAELVDRKLDDPQKVKDAMEDWSNGLQRYLALQGWSAKSLAPQVVDPSPQINVQVEAICVKLGIPVRIFKGSERGELASSQDDAAWNDRLRQRQREHVTPRVIVPFVDRLIWLGVLPRPAGYSVFWPDLTSQTEAEKAAVAAQKTAALAQYVGGQVEAVVPPLDYLTRILGMDEEEAAAILEGAVAAAEEAGEEPAVPDVPPALAAAEGGSFFGACPRDEKGHCVAGGGAAAGGKRGLAAKAAGAISRMKAAVAARIPEPVKKVAGAMTTAAFLPAVAGNRAVQAVARERGFTEDQVGRLAKAVATVDVATGGSRAAAVAAAVGLPGAALPAAFVPWGSTGYLAYSTARNPAATFRAAKKGIAAAVAKVKTKLTRGAPAVSTANQDDGEDTIRRETVELLAEALAGHGWDEWYEALLYAALDETTDPAEAVRLADATYAERPSGPADEDTEEDVDDLFRDREFPQEEAP
jgi:hypothetical protein